MLRTKKALVAALFATLTLSGAPAATAAPATQENGVEEAGESARLSGPKNGKLRLLVRGPKGMPATVAVTRGKTKRVLAKKAAGSVRRATLSLTPGKALIHAPDVVHQGRTYRATLTVAKVRGKKTTRTTVIVRTKRAAQVTVRYRKLAIAQNARVKTLTPTSATLTWDKTRKGMKVVVRRSAGSKPAASVRKGTSVKVNSKTRTAKATGLTTGTTYTFTVFTLKGKKVLGRQWVSGSPFDLDTPEGGYLALSSSLIFENAKSAPRATVQGSRVQMELQGRIPTIGSGVVLPPSSALPYGLVGVVSSISADGRTATLRNASLDEVFTALSGSSSLAGGKFVPVAEPKKTVKMPALSQGRGIAPSAAGKKLPSCLGGTYQQSTINVDPSFDPTGTFDTGLVTTSIFGKKFTRGAWVSTSVDLRPRVEATVKTTGSISCGVELPRFIKPFTIGPVPMTFIATPVVEVAADGEVNVKGVGLQGSLGASLDAEISLPSGLKIDPEPIMSSTPLEATVESGNHQFRATAAVEINVGPGAATQDAGAVVGVSGQIKVLEATSGPKWPVGDSRHSQCVNTRIESGASLGFEARVWLKTFEAKRDWSYSFPQKEWADLHFPKNCQNLTSPTDDVFGDDVEFVDDDIVGDPGQVGHDDIFSPGKSAWILSTGVMGQLRGTPDFFATTDLGGEGDAKLSALVGGLDTNDAAVYRTTVIPKKGMLHVRYIFASEEYPEFVGSDYNDVMAVYVNGVNCALVNGEAVSVNVINGNKNSELFVPNYTGTGGFETTMNGFTTPQQCNVPVTPGKPAEIEIAVADTSDGGWDSAVALLDKGIWSS